MFPSSLEASFANPMPSDQRSGHSQLHRDINAVVIALQAKLGIDGSLDNTSIDFLLKSDEDPGHTHTKGTVGLSNVANALQLIAANNLSDLTNVTTAVANLGLTFAKSITIASQAEAEAGVENTKMMTPLRVKQEIAIFATPIASDAEVITATETAKAITPAQLRYKTGMNLSVTSQTITQGGTTQVFSAGAQSIKGGVVTIIRNYDGSASTNANNWGLQFSSNGSSWTNMWSKSYTGGASQNPQETSPSFILNAGYYYRVFAGGTGSSTVALTVTAYIQEAS